MSKNPRHIKLLTDYELTEIKNKYSIKLIEDNVVVAVNTRNQTTIHKLGKKFNLRVGERKFTISERALELWANGLNMYNVLDIQHIINTLLVARQEPSYETVKKLLKKVNDFS